MAVLQKVLHNSSGGFRYKDQRTSTIAHKSAVQHRSAPRKTLTRQHKRPAFLLAIDAQIRASQTGAAQPSGESELTQPVHESAEGGVFAWMDESDRSAGATSLPWSPLECKLLGGAPKQSIYDFFRRSAKAESADDSSGAAQPTACLLYTSPSPRDLSTSRMPASA